MTPRRLWWSESKSQNPRATERVGEWPAALVVRLQFYAAPESGGRQPQHPSRSKQPFSLCRDPSRCTGTGRDETFSEHFAVENRRSRWGYLKDLRFSGRCQSAGSSKKSWSVPGSPPFLLKEREMPKRNPAEAGKTRPQRKHQDQRHSDSNQRAPTEHPKAFLSLLGNSIQRRLQRNSKRPRFRFHESGGPRLRMQWRFHPRELLSGSSSGALASHPKLSRRLELIVLSSQSDHRVLESATSPLSQPIHRHEQKRRSCRPEAGTPCPTGKTKRTALDEPTFPPILLIICETEPEEVDDHERSCRRPRDGQVQLSCEQCAGNTVNSRKCGGL